MIKKLSLVTAFLLAVVFANTQGLNKIEQHKLDSIIDRYFERSDWEHSSPEIGFGYGPSSLFICILHLDSIGKVGRVQLLSDHQYKDSIYAIFSRLNPAVFKTWQSAENGNKTIVIPFAYASPKGKPAFVRDFAEHAIAPGVFNNTIVLPTQVFGWGRWHRFH